MAAVRRLLNVLKSKIPTKTPLALSKPKNQQWDYVRPFPLVFPEPELPQNIVKPNYNLELLAKMRNQTSIITDKNEIEKLKAASKLAKEGRELAMRLVKTGVTTDFIDREVHNYFVKNSGYPSPLKYRGFPRSTCTSVNDVAIHGVPDSRKLQNGDIVSIDVSVYLNGYNGDTCDTVFINDHSTNLNEFEDEIQKLENLVSASKSCLHAGIGAVEVGQKFTRIGEAIETHLFEHYPEFSISTQFVGHGVGKYFHMAPHVVHWKSGFIPPNVKKFVVEEGQCFTIEPLIIEGGFPGLDTLGDGWTAISSKGFRSAQHEHTCWINPDSKKVELLTG